MSGVVSADLKGRRILVVEDEYMIAQEIDESLAGVGASTLGPVSGVGGAMRLIAGEERIDGAVLDVNLGHESIWPVVDTLMRRGVPLLLATGYDVSAIPPAYAKLPRCEKPATAQDLTRALVQVLNSAAGG